MNTPEKPHKAKEALIKAAQALVIEKGYEAVSTRELAEAAEVNLGAIQYHFGSKAKLFVEAVRTMMHGSDCNRGREVLEIPVVSQADAGVRLGEFIFVFLDSLLHPKGPQPFKVMLREIFTPTSKDEEMFEALISTAVNDFIRPNSEMLARVLRQLAPNLSSDEIAKSISSIIGQCFFYLSHAPFLQRLRGIDCAASPHFEEAARHVAAFSMRGMGCSEELIASSLGIAEEKFQQVLMKQGKI